MKKILVFVMILSNSLLAEVDFLKDSSLGTKIGTLGVGIEYSTKLTNSITGRIGVNGLSYDQSGTESDVEYDIDASLRTLSAIADYYPTSSGFRISAGAMYNKNKLEFSGKATGSTYNINGTTYNASDVGSLDGEVDFDSFAPYIGIGYTTRSDNSKWLFNAELGAMYQGEPNTSLNVTCGSSLNTAQCNALKANVEAERNDLDKELDGFEWYPVLSIGLSYKF